ncbi:OmpH family outer membrane protein [Basfia succiniciproducens]|uniref:HlpA protein n=1 Tax=Mannheimia succiniciproducens (strain KCTC 0769BP / MBEL55E) TaxID=221988 RepID=Q65R80_MANSM|nr:OmpH family outer membrane protein [[Mannheimia] succiniciproducens]AAU38530.1 HlpA protein [[Mannheimia] succiniciproducens MBEL55E]
MKKVVKATALSLALALTSSMAMAAENIAFINAGYLFQHHPDREAVAKKLDSEFKTQADKLAANKKSIDAKIASLQKDAQNPKNRPSELKKREDEINKLMKDHDEEVRKFQVENDKRQNEERAKLLEGIQVATNNIAKDKGYTYVLDANSVVFAADGKDITEDVLKAIGGKTETKPAEATK